MKRNRLKKLGDFVLGKGFYIVLFLCAAAIGISGYYLIRTVTVGSQPSQPAAASQTVTLPDASSPAPPTPEGGPEGPAPEPMKRYVHPIPAPAERPAPPGPEALDRVLECLAGQNQLLVELLGAVNGLSAAVLSIRENLAEG